MSYLKREWGVSAGLSLVFLAAGWALLAGFWSPVIAVFWLPLPLLAVLYLYLVAYRNLTHHRRSGEHDLLTTFGWGNRLTLLRGVFISAMAGFVVLPHPPGWLEWIPGILYTLADAADFFDGYVARITNHTTRLGEILDLSFDGLGVLIAATIAVQYGKVPTWYLLVGLARYLYLAGLWLRRKLGKLNHDLPPNLSRRVFAGLQMGFLAAVLWPVFTPPGTEIAATLFGIPLLYGFGRDWLYVSGILSSAADGAARPAARLQHALPPAIRGLILLLNLPIIGQWIQSAGRATPEWIALGLLNLLLVLMLSLGILPRIAAIGGLCLLGFYQLIAPLTTAQIGLAVLYTVILYAGGGMFSAWAPEEYLFHRQAGSSRSLEARPGA